MTAALLCSTTMQAMASENEDGTLVTLNNGESTMSIDTSKGGRIMSLKFGGKEIISQLRWPESFGSTFWTSPQKEWNWPPVAEFDKQAYTIVERKEKRLVISSPVSKRLHMSVGKEFSVAGENAFTVTYSIKNEGSEPRRVAPWEITRVPNADGIIFFSPTDSIWPSGIMTFNNAYGAAWYKTDEAPQNRKVNADGQGWLAYFTEGILLVKTFQDLQTGEPASGEAEIQVYVNRGKTFIELESQGAYTMLQPGERLSWTVGWHLTPVGETLQPSPVLMEEVRKIVR